MLGKFSLGAPGSLNQWRSSIVSRLSLVEQVESMEEFHNVMAWRISLRGMVLVMTNDKNISGAPEKQNSRELYRKGNDILLARKFLAHQKNRTPQNSAEKDRILMET